MPCVPPSVPSVEEVCGRRDLRAFVELPYHLYRGDTLWVPPLRSRVYRRLSHTHPFFRRARMALFLARVSGRVSGRIAAIVNDAHNTFHAERCGFFGFFEATEEPAVADALLRRAEQWCADQGMTTLRGPVNPSTNDECGLLIEGFHSRPAVLMPYNPRFYAERFEAHGLRRCMDLHAYELSRRDNLPLDRLRRLRERLANRRAVQIRTVRLERFEEEIEIVRSIYNAAWERNWGFVPLSAEEFRELARDLRSLLNPELVFVAEVAGQPAGFSLTLPDINRALRHLRGRLTPWALLKLMFLARRIDHARVITLGVLPEHRKLGLEALFYLEIMERTRRLGIHSAELSWILESNDLMIGGIESLGGRMVKRYRIYEKAIST